MRVEVHFFGDMKRFTPPGATGRKAAVDLPTDSDVDRLCEQLGIGDEGCVIMVNDTQHHRGTVLHDGDMVTFLPPLVGGA